MASAVRGDHRARALAGGALLLAGICLGVGGGAEPAAAHDWLVSSTPERGARLDSGPSDVTLTFSDRILDLGDQVVVADPSGHDWSSGAPRVDGRRLTIAVQPGLPESAYQIRWRVVSADGHPATGVIPFAVGQASPWPASATPSTPSPAQIGIRAEGPVGASSPTRLAAAGAGGATVALAAYAGVVYARRTRDRTQADDRTAERKP